MTKKMISMRLNEYLMDQVKLHPGYEKTRKGMTGFVTAALEFVLEEKQEEFNEYLDEEY